MKKIILTLTVVLMLVSLIKVVFCDGTDLGNINVEYVTVLVDGKIVEFPDAQPFIDENSRTLVPIRPIAEALGVDVGWDDSSKTVTLFGKRVVSFVIGENKATIDEQVAAMDTAAMIINSRTYVPLRFASEFLGAAVEWYGNTRTANIWMREDNYEYGKPLDPEKEAEKRAKIIESLPQYMGKKGADTIYTYDEITEEEAERRAKIIEELKEYQDNIGAGTKGTYSSYNQYVLEYGDQDPRDHAQIATAFIEIENNVDYRTITERFIDEYRYFFKPGRGHRWYFWVDDKWYNTDERIQKRYDDIKKYRIIQKARFITDETLFHVSYTGCRQRGRFEVYFESASSEYLEAFEKNMIVWTGGTEGHKNTLRVLNTGRWYYCDIEISLGNLASKDHKLWEHSKFNFCDVIYLSEFKPLED